MIEDAVMNATKNMLIEDLLPEVSLKCNDDAERLIKTKDAKINDLEEKVEKLEGLINQLQRQVQVLKNPAFLSLLFYSSYAPVFMKPFIFRKSSFLPKDGEREVQL